MKLGDVLRKERGRKKLSDVDVVKRLGITLEQYREMEAGNSTAEDWGPRLALIAMALQVPTSRLIAKTGKSAQANQVEGQCGKLIATYREQAGLTQQELAEKLAIVYSEMDSIENGVTPLEFYGPILLSFAEIVEQPIFNLFYPCGLPLEKLTDYP